MNIDKIAKQRNEFIEKSVQGIEQDVAKLQTKLLNTLFDSIISKLQYEDGKLKQTPENFRLINKIDLVINDFNYSVGNNLIKGIGEKLVQIIGFTDDYYTSIIKVPESQLKQMKNATKWIYERIGIKSNGMLIENGYLAKLTEMPEVRTALRDYVVNNVTTKAGISEFMKGFKSLLTDSADKVGKLTAYHKQFTFDVFNQVDEAINNSYSEAVGLDYFIYGGTIIDTSRCFCKKRVNKIFSKDDAKTWRKDPTLLLYYKVNPYNPLIDRGGFNCRHTINYITKQMAEQLGYNPIEAEAIVNEEC